MFTRKSFRSFKFFELPTKVDTGTGSAEKPCFLSDHIQPPPGAEDLDRNRLKGILNREFELDQRPTVVLFVGASVPRSTLITASMLIRVKPPQVPSD